MNTDGLANDDQRAAPRDAATTDTVTYEPVTDARADTSSPVSPCDGGNQTQAHFICADFDHGSVAEQFSSTRLTPGGSVELDEAHVSPPRSMRATIPAVPSAYAEARLERVLPTTPRRFRLSADIFVCPSGPTDAQELFKLAEPSGEGMKLVREGASTRIVARLADRPSRDYPLEQTLPQDRWFKLTMDVVVDSTSGSIAIAYDGAPVLERTNVPTVGSEGISTFYIGLWANSGEGPCSTLFDNIVVDLDL